MIAGGTARDCTINNVDAKLSVAFFFPEERGQSSESTLGVPGPLAPLRSLSLLSPLAPHIVLIYAGLLLFSPHVSL